MHPSTKKLIQLNQLRQRAQARLERSGSPAGAPHNPAVALSVLHQLASSAETADQALALLHEIQVHQVEIDLQAEELRDALAGCESVLDRQIAYHDAMPVACCGLDSASRLLELNETGARWMGLPRARLLGQTLHAFLTPEGKQLLLQHLSSLQQGTPVASWETTLLSDQQSARRVQAALSPDPVAGRFILVLMSLGAEPPA